MVDNSGEPICRCQDVGMTYCEFNGKCVLAGLTGRSHNHCVQSKDRAWMCDAGYFEFGGICHDFKDMTEIC